jgi:hypothetical protein
MFESINTKKELLDFMRQNMPNKEPYEASYDLIEKFRKLSIRFYQIRFATITLMAIKKIKEQDLLRMKDDFFYNYNIYFAYLLTDLAVLLNLDGGSNSYSAKKLFNEINLYIKNYVENEEVKAANGIIVFNQDTYKKLYKNFKKILKQSEPTLDEITELRNKYTAHNDLNINISSVNFEEIINIVIAFQGLWFNLAKSMGIIIERTNNFIDTSEYKIDVTNYENEADELYSDLIKYYSRIK